MTHQPHHLITKDGRLIHSAFIPFGSFGTNMADDSSGLKQRQSRKSEKTFSSLKPYPVLELHRKTTTDPKVYINTLLRYSDSVMKMIQAKYICLVYEAFLDLPDKIKHCQSQIFML